MLPDSFVRLMESDDLNTRLRHNTMGLTLPDDLVSVSSHPDHKLLMYASEVSYGYWYLLLSPDGGHVVVFSEKTFGIAGAYPDGHQPVVTASLLYKCARHFSAWLVAFFEQCVKEDEKYEELLKTYPPK